MSELPAGRSLGPYEIVEELGRGGMATVYKARQPSLDRFVALKVLAAHLSHDPDFVARFTREATIAARLEHPQIVPIYDVGQADGEFYIAMRFIAGRSLSDVIRNDGQLPIQRVIAILDQIASALDHAHRHGVVHRDLKPGNVLLEGDDRAYLADFGIARAGDATRVTRMGTLIGTPRYMSPEQAQGLEADHRSDLYALGVIAFELLTGQTPFHADSVATLLHQHVYEPPPPLRSIRPELPERLEAAISRMLAKDPEDRFPDASAFVRALAEGPRTETMLHPVAAVPSRTAVAPTRSAGPRSEHRAAAPSTRQSERKLPVPIFGVVAAVVVLAIAGLTLPGMLGQLGGGSGSSPTGTPPVGRSTPTDVAAKVGGGGVPTTPTSPTAAATGSPSGGGAAPTSTASRAGTPTAATDLATPTRPSDAPATATAPVAPTATTRVVPPTPTQATTATPTVAQETPIVHEPIATPTVATSPPTHTPTVVQEWPTHTPTVVQEPPTPTQTVATPTAPVATATPTTTAESAAESPTAIACDRLANPVLSASVSPDRTVMVAWNTTGGCGPFDGTIEARYEGEASPYKVHQIGLQSGNLVDRPAARCGGTQTLVYAFELRDRAGQVVSRTTNASISWPC